LVEFPFFIDHIIECTNLRQWLLVNNIYMTVQVYGGSSRNGLLKSQVFGMIFLSVFIRTLSVEQMQTFHYSMCCFVDGRWFLPL